MPCAVLAKTELGMERYVANNLDVECDVEAAPKGFQGLVLLKGCKNYDEAVRKLMEMPEVIRVMVAEECVKADLKELKNIVRKFVDRIEGKKFAVRTVRRGKHTFTSIQVNAELGSAILSLTKNAKVDLSNPDIILMVEIIGDEAYVALVGPEYVGLKKMRGKIDLSKLMKKVRVFQEPYLGPLSGVREVGKRIGRILESYGVSEYYFALIEPVSALELAELIHSVEEGARSRRQQKEKTEGKKERTALKVFDMYHLVGSKSKKEVVITFEPEGESFERVAKDIGEAMRKAKKVTLVLGSRKGTPMGLYRFADFVVDIAPGIVLSTETALAAALESVALAYLLSQGSDVGPSLSLSSTSKRSEGGGSLSEEEG